MTAAINLKEIIFSELTNEHLLFDKKFLLSISGGVDSMVLLDVFIRLQNENESLKISVFHFNHQTRPNENKAEAELVQSICKKYNIPLFSEVWRTKPVAGNFQNEARQERIRRLLYILEQTQSDFIVTAHHADDQLETQLQRIFKGATLANLKGMSVVSGKFFRPLLFQFKQDLIAYALENNIAYMEDSSNQTDDYERNRIRHHIIPYLNEIYHDQWKLSLQHLAEQSKLWKDDLSEFYKRKRQEFVVNHPEGFQIVFTDQQPYFESFYIGFLKRFFEEKGFDFVGNQQVKKVWLFYQNARRGQRLSLTTDIPIIKMEKGILLLTQGEALASSLKIIVRQSNKRPEQLHINNRMITVDADRLKQPLRVRTKKEGDVFKPLGLTTSQKLSDFFINRKIDKHKRDYIPLIIDAEDDIIWIYGIEISDKIKITSQTKKFITLKAEEV